MIESPVFTKNQDPNDVMSDFLIAARNELVAEHSPEAENILQLLDEFTPTSVYDSGRFQFLLSAVGQDPYGRDHCVGYVRDEEGRVAPRMFYRSTSEGDWRVSPYMEGTVYSKGEKYDHGYVRETRVVDGLREQLEAKSRPSRKQKWSSAQAISLNRHFQDEALGSRGYSFYHSIADRTNVRALPVELFQFIPGEGFYTPEGQPTAAEVLSKVEIPIEAAPNLSTTMNVKYHSNHPLLGPITTERILSNRGNILWHFSYDNKGAVWMSGITTVTESPNSYGTDQEVLLAGILDSKPIDYNSQTAGLGPEDYRQIVGTDYSDISPFLLKIPVIRDYAQSRGLIPTRL